MGFRLALLASLLLLFSAGACAGYTQWLTVQVFDQSFRPVEGAQAYAQYQLNAVQGTTNTKPVLTGANGLVNFSFTNYEQIDNSTSTSYTLYVKYGSQLNNHSLIATNTTQAHPRVYTSIVKSYYLSVRVHDQKSAALPADVTIGGQTKRADAAGEAIFQLAPGAYTAKAELPGIVKNKDFNLSADSVLDFAIPLYSLSVSVTDDAKKPLLAFVEADGKQENTSAEGLARFYNLTNGQPQVIVRYKESYKRISPNLQLQSNVGVVFDQTKPVVKELHSALSKNGGGTISLYVEDPGTSSSGIDTVTVSYEVNGVESTVPAYAVGYNTFEAKIPVQPPDTLVKYTVKVADKDGNIGLGAGNYAIPPEEKPSTYVAPKDAGLKLTPEIIIGGILAFAVVAYAIFYFMKKRGELAQPPPNAPPQVPQQ